MNKLILKPKLKKKLDKLDKKVSSLQYSGNNPNILLAQPVVAVVGTRKPTPYGKQLTEQITSELARAGVVIVSGLAFGVDTIAHNAALAENGSTIAILPSGIDNIYPSAHINVAKSIIKNGSIISEYPAKHQPRKVEFLERNRIIAALADAVLIPEAAERSGSLNTAQHAIKMGIDVYCVPGPITSQMSKGTNNLIKDGRAQMVTEAKDIIKKLGIKTSKNKPLTGGNEHETKILAAIAGGLQDPTEILRELDIEMTEFQTSLTMLELNGKITQDEIGAWHLS